MNLFYRPYWQFLRIVWLALTLSVSVTPPALALGKASFVIVDQPGASGVTLFRTGYAATLLLDATESRGVARAARDLRADLQRVGATPAPLLHAPTPSAADVILIGTLGTSKFIDDLAATGKINVTDIKGKWEHYLIQVVNDPMPGVKRAVVIAGSDKRGTIFGIYEVSEQIGVSPWYWWADVPTSPHQALVVAATTRVVEGPAVQYRGIFLNDEAPALTSWAKQRYGGFNRQFYQQVFELVLRMRGNYVWPAMWGSAFYTDDPGNGALADEMGIVMGTSHHEPMMRAHSEWKKSGGRAWDYAHNAEQLQQFWHAGIARTKAWDKVVTIGMRGDGDEPMSADANIALLERIVSDQRHLITRETGADAASVPQVWALYKEVQEYYDKGMSVPDDVILLWCDDNWGNLRRLPTATERKRAGGAGVYYHFDYVGGPRSYKWINVTPIPKIWEQMHLAYEHDAKKMWIVNVGDLKPMEIPTEFFLNYAWNPSAWPAERLPEYTQKWAEREFGKEYAQEIATIVDRYTQFNGRRKPEQLAPTTYSLINYHEASRVRDEYNALAAEAAALSQKLPQQYRDAYFQLVLHPVRASATINDLYISTGLNWMYAKQRRASTNAMASHVRGLFQLDADITRQYHQNISNGKWMGMMSQPHIGYTSWNDPKENILPKLFDVDAPPTAMLGVALEGSELAWPGAPTDAAILPPLDVFDTAGRYLDVFNRGTTPFTYQVTASQPWITISRPSGTLSADVRIKIGVRWADVPEGPSNVALNITGAGETVRVTLPVNKPAGWQTAKGRLQTAGVVAIEAEHSNRQFAAPGRKWQLIPGHGRTWSGMTTTPVTADALTVEQGMRLEYDVHLQTPGSYTLHVTLAPTLNFKPGPGLRYAVAIDDEAPQIVNAHEDNSLAEWERRVSNGAMVLRTTHSIKKAGAHIIKVYALDTGLVLQKLVLENGSLKPTYLGPPESPIASQ